MTIPYVQLGYCLFFLFWSALFSASETALFSIPRERVAALEKGGGSSRKKLYTLLIDGQRTLYFLLLGNLFVNITLTGCIHAVVTVFFTNGSPLLTMVFATSLIVVFGEVIPKNIALKHNEKIGALVAPPLYWGTRITSPLLSVVGRVNLFFLVQIRRRFRRPSPFVTAAELKSSVIESGRKGAISSGEQEMLVTLLDRGTVPVAHCMEHRSHLVLFPADACANETLEALVKKKRTRAFVYGKEAPGQVEGVVKLAKLLTAVPEQELIELVEPIVYVPESMEAAEVIGLLMEKRCTEVAVVDEYGSFIGVVSLESGMEYILNPVFSPLEQEGGTGAGDSTFDGVYAGETEIETMEWLPEVLQTTAGGIRTLSGALTNYLGSIPPSGDKFAIGRWNFYILSASAVKIESIFIKKRHGYDN